MADYHMLGDSVFGVAGSGLMDDTQNMVGAGSYGHNTSMNVSGPGMMSQNMPMAPSQNPGNMIQGMVGMQQAQPVQSGSQMPPGSMGSYHQGSVHGYTQNEVPQKLHQYAGYGSQLQPSGSASGQYMTAGPRLHHLGDAMASPAPSQQQQQQQQPTPRAMVANQMAYQSRNMSGNHYGQQMMHSNAAPTQITQNPAQYSNQYASVPHHQYQQHSIQQVNQGADVWQSSMNHPQMSRQCIPQAQSYPPHQTLPSQHGNNSMTLSPLAMQSQRPSTPNQSQYVAGPDYPVQHPSAQTVQMQRSPVYNLNSSTVNQNGTHIVQGSGPSQSVIPQAYSSIPQNEQGITFPQGHYTPPTQAAPNRPHYIPSSTAGSTVTQSPQQHLVGQQPMIGMRPSMHQMGYSPVSSRVNSGQQHSGTLPPGSPARVQPQYHPPFSPNQGYPPSAQPSPRSVTGETATPPHIPHYSQSVAQSPTSPQYRSQFPTQLTQSPQHLAATPPAEASAPTSSCTPDRSHHSTPVPQSQGSFPSPSTTHMTSPGQGQSPGNSGTPSNSLQHLEQMVMPHVSSVTSTSNVTNAVASGSPAMSHNSVMGGNYYAHLHTQSQHHQTHMSSANETRPQPLSPAVSHVSTQQHSHLGYMGPGVSIGQQQQQQPLPLPQPSQQSQPQLQQQQQQPQQQSQQQSSIVTPSVSQSVPPIVSAMNALTKSSTPDDDGSLLDLDSSQNNSLMGYSPISNNQEVISQDGMIAPPQPVVSAPTLPPSVPPPPPAPANHMGPVSNSNSQPMQIPPHQYGTGHNQYQSNVPPVTYEIQKIQHEIQQLNGPNQTPECQEKLKNLQDRLRYLQSQSNEPGPPDSIPMNVHGGGMSSQYPRPPMVYGNTGPPSYMHQQSMQPHPMHYNPSGPPVRQERPMPVLGPQTNHMMNDLYSSANASSCGSLEQDSVENVIPPNYPPLVPEAVPSMMPATMPPIDPYEMTFNDEPPKKMKRRTPKEPKEPKPPKEKKPPKPKKPKKSKNDTSMPPLLEGAYGPLPENGEQVANAEPGSELPPANLDMPMNPEVPEKKKKNRKRKTKEKENDEPSAEPKEPKPKKPRKKSPKQPKQPKVPKDAEATAAPVEQTEGDSAVTAEPGEAKILSEGAEPPTEEGGEVKSEKKKEKKESKSKSPKTPGSSKEGGGGGGGSKKSTPKKKLPKIALRFTSKKKKKKPLGASDIENSDMERTPPPSPEDGEGKRRSARNTNRKKYTDDIELHLSDDTIELEFGQSPILNSEGKVVQVVMDSHNEDHMVVEKILATRSISKQLEEKPGSDGENSNSVIDSVEVEEYYVKYKNLSYIHCEWKTLEELEQGDRRFLQKVKRYKQKKAEFNFFDFLEDEPFNPDYIEVDRVLDVNEIPEFLVSEGAKPPEILKSEVDEIEGEQSEKSVNQDAEAADQSETVKTEAEELETNPELSSNENEAEFKTADVKEETTSETPDENKPELSPPLLEMPDITASENTNNNESSETFHYKKEPKSETDSADQEVKTEEGENIDKTEGENVDKTEGENVDKTEGENVDKTEGENVDKTEGENVDKTDGENVNKIEEKPGKVTRHYLVKWRALTYEESTWELEEDVDRSRIEQFERFRYPPPKEKWKIKKKPKYSEWDKIEGVPVYKGENTLREYQLEGVNWLTFCWYNQQNCILADEMGLGKTIQSIAFLNEIDKYGIPGPFLIIAPLSTIGNWQREFETWTDLNTITYHGSSPSRNMILEYEMYWKNEKGERIQEVYKFQVLITTFEIILTDCLELRAIPWRCVIIDEAHRLKNRNCKLLEGLRLLNTEHRVLLTGTPLQNNVEELFSLLNFLEPNRFASTEAFLEEFGDLKTEAQVDKLKALLKPMMLRRLKEDVEKSLAPKEETVIEVELTNIQKKYYRAILERNFTFLTKGNCYSNIPNLMNTMMELRKCCIHPFLINGAEEQIISDYKIHHEEVVEAQLNAMVQASGKLVLIDKLLPRLRADGHRVLVFSQMVKCLDILEDYMVQKRYPYERIDGRVRGNLRQAAIDRFCKPDSDRFVFLLCTRAGGLGINLTAADTVIIFDSDWNPQNDLQAQARCHRIGQSKAVKVYRLICRNTYEREMFDKASLKLGLDKAVLQSMNPSKENIGMNQQMSKKEIEDLLRKGAYGALMEDDNAGDKFCEEDIDQILQRRTQVIHVESGVQGSTFSKATFASASTRSDIEIDDPNFWEKWAKKANLDVDELKSRNELIIQEPRRRTQTRRFGTDDHMMDLSDLETSDDDDENVSARTRAGKRCTKLGRIRPKNRGRALDREKDEEYMEDIAPGNWTRAECFKVEKGLLTFGWGRWDECIALGQFRRPLSHKDCEHISRTILLYCLLHYKGDEKIKSFIWDLICPTYDGEQPIHRNHSEVEIVYEKEGVLEGLSPDEKGLSAPVPRGRKGKKIKKEIKAVDTVIEESEWAKEEQYNPDILLNDEAYRKHLNRHANKVLLRVRLLYYLKHEIIGDLHLQVFSGIPASLIPLEVPPADGEPPAPWWDREVDKSLLLGIYKHGFERYNLMRQDPSLCFLSRCGPPDGAALWAELNANAEDLAEQANQEEVAEKEGKFSYDKELDELEPLSPSSESHSSKASLDQSRPFTQPSLERINALMSGIPIFPSVTDVNTRVRRLITAYQRNNKKLEIRNAQKARLVALTLQKMERREKFEAAIREREMKKRELQQRKWSRREEADFYRTISAFGVEYTEDKKDYNWARFRNLARLERKYDETLAEYYKSFYAMCKRVCGKKLTEEEEQLSFVVDPISEDRASRCLQRVDLLHKIREEILSNPELDERLKLCQPSMDLPDWWQCGKHDKDLLIGAAKHGLSRMDYHLLHDSTLSFKEVVKNHPHAKSIQIGSHMSTPIGCSSPAMTSLSTEETPVKDDVYSSGGGVKEEVKISLLQKLEESVDKTLQKEQPTSESMRNVARKLLDSSMEDMDVDKIENIEKDLSLNAKTTQEYPKKEEELDTLKNEAIPELEDQTQPLKEKTESLIIAETKLEEECKAEDEETDIETDIKKDEEQKESAQQKTVNVINIKTEPESNSLEPPVLEEQEKCEQKYECDTDTDIKTTEETEVKDPNLKGEALKDKEQLLSVSVQGADQKPTAIVKEEIKVEEKKKESVIKEVKEECPSLIDDQNDEVMSQASFNLEGELGEPTVAQLLAITNGNTVRWPKDKVLQIRLEHIVQAVEKNEWPVIRPLFLANFPGVPSTSVASASNTPAPRTASPSPHRSSPAPSLTSRDGHSRDATPLATPEPPPIRESVLPELPITPVDFNMLNKSPVQPPSSGSGGDAVKHRRRRRRRRFEIEAERAKLRQLLSHNMQQQQQQHQQQLHHVQQFLASTNSSLLRSKAWDDHVDDKLQLPSVVPPPVLVPSPLPPPTVASSTAAAPPPAHQNSSPRLSTTLGSLDLRVKSSVTPVSFASVLPPPKPPIPQPAEDLSKSAGSPSSPMDLSASAGFSGQASSSGGSSAKSMVRARIKEGRSSKGGSRIDALALNLQARKQQQLMQEQHHGLPLDPLLASEHSERIKDPIEPEISAHSHIRHHHHSQHQEKRNPEEEETKLRRKRLQYSEEAVRKSLNRAFEMARAPPAHSSFLNTSLSSNLTGSSSRLHLGSKHDDQHNNATNPLLDHSGLMHHDFKKWLEEHPELVATNPNLVAAAAAAMAFNPVPSFPSHTELLELPEGRRRGRRPRLDPTKLDFDKVTGEENVSVINRLTGKKITGSKAPPLKHLTEWLDKNPMFDVDPKWGPLVREKGNLPKNMMARIVTPSEKRGRRTAAALLASAHQNLVTPPSTMSFPSASSLNPLSFANAGMLAGFPNMNFFKDPPKVTSTLSSTTTTVATSSSNPPIFLPFGGLAGMGLTNPLFGFPGFNFPGLQGASPLSSSSLSSKEQGKDNEKSSKSDKASDIGSSSRKNLPVSTSSVSASSIISGSGMPSATSLPFLYPAPSLLYNPLGLGNFALPPNLPASFASFSQSGLVNGLGLNSPLITTNPMNTTSATSLVSSPLTSTIPLTSHAPLGSSIISKLSSSMPSSKHSPSHSSALETQDTDEESLKSLMGTHDADDEDDMDEGKLENYDNLEKDDSDRDFTGKSPIFSTGRNSTKVSESESENTNVSKNPSLIRPVVDNIQSNKTKGVSDDPTSDSTDTESKNS